MSPKNLEDFDLNKIKQRMAQGEDRATDALHFKIEEEAAGIRERSFGRTRRRGFEGKKGRHRDDSGEFFDASPVYDNSGYSTSQIEEARDNLKVFLGLGFSANEINEVYSREDLAEILQNNYTKDKWLEISRARFSGENKNSAEQKIGNKQSIFVGENENKKTIQAKVKILKHDIKLAQSEIAKNKKESKDIFLLGDRLKKLENELAEKQSILDFYDAGLTNEDINKLSNVSDYVNRKIDDKLLNKKGFIQGDIKSLTEEERNQILDSGVTKDEFVMGYEDGEYSSSVNIKKIEDGLIRLRTALKYAKTDDDKSEISKKINKAEISVALLKRGFSNTEINRMSAAEATRILNTNMSKGMYIESLRNKKTSPENNERKENPPTKSAVVPMSPEAFSGDDAGLGDVDDFRGVENGRFLPVLGFTNEDLRGMSIEDQQKAFREQITKEEWFKNHAEALVQEDAVVNKEQKEEERNIRVLSVRHSDEEGLDVHVRYVSVKEAKELLNSGDVQVDIEDLNKKIEEQEEVIKELRVVDGSEEVIKQEEEELEDLEALKQEALNKPKNETLEPELEEKSDYEERKDVLEKNGWSKEEYEALTKEDQDFVYWKGVKEEEYSRNKTPEENNTNVEDRKKETVSEFVDRIWATKNESGSIHLQVEDEDFYNQNSEEIKKEIAKRGALEAAGNESGTKDVSENAQDLPEDERGVNEAPSINLENISVSSGVKERLSDLGIESLQSLYAMSPEFFSLLPDKQMYLLSKIEQKIYLDADLASKDQNEEEIKNMGFFKKIGASFTKDQRQVSLRDKAINKIIDGGLEDYKEDIATLGKYLMGAPKLKYRDTIKGRPVPNFEYVQVGNSRDQKIEEAKTFFNASASRFSEIPYEWSLETATNSQRKIYREALEDYMKEKNELSRAMLSAVEKEYQDKGKTNEEEIEIAGKYKEAQTQVMMMIRETDMHVNFGRYITQNPEMEKISSSFSEKILGTDMGNWAKGAALIGAGYATKWLGRTFAATGIGIVVAGAVGGYLADRKKRLEFEGKELRKRYGKEVDDLGIKKSINSENVHERLGKLVSQFEKTTDDKSKARILETIKTRIFVTDEMMRDGRINFGKSKDQIVNQFKISDLMSKAAVLVEMNGGFGVDTNTDGVFDKSTNEASKEEQVFERFKQFIKDDQAQSEKDKARALAVLKGASVAMLGFSFGAGIRHAQEQGYFNAAWEAMLDKSGDAVEKIKNLKGQITGVPYDYFKTEGTPITPKTSEIIGGEGLSQTPEDLTVKNIPSESGVLESAMAGSRGAIGAIDDLQDSLKLKFGNDVPAQYKDLMAKTPDQLAREWGFYKPGEVNESAVIKKGEGFSIDSKGVVRFMGLNGEDVVYKPEAVTEVEAVESERKFFNAGNESSGAPENSYAKAPSRDFDYEKALRAKIDEGYNVVSKEIKPGPSNWYEKPVPTEFSKEPAPNVTSVSEGQDFVLNKEASPSKAVPVAESANVSGKSYEISFDEREGKKYIPIAALSSWNMDDTPVARNEALGEIINSKYHEALKYNLDFDRLAVAQEFLDSGKYPAGSEEYEALQNTINEQKNKISAALRAEDVFETAVPSPGKSSLGGVEYLTNSSTQVDLGSKLFKADEVVNTYGEVTGSSKNLVSFKNGYIGIYEEAKDQGLINEKINKIRRDNAGKIGTLVYEKATRLQDGTIRVLKIYKK